jgi:hypothetical protein
MVDIHLRVFRNKSELILPDGTTQVFLEGSMSQPAKLRYQKITGELSKGYLETQILRCTDTDEKIRFNEMKDEKCQGYIN